ncbi:MAG TPA: type II secretion system protein, partial [Polyangiaceae bacterium]
MFIPGIPAWFRANAQRAGVHSTEHRTHSTDHPPSFDSGAAGQSPITDRYSLSQRERASAFTLLELLMVIGIIAILLVLIAPAFTTIKSGTEVTTAIYGVKGLLENARACAKANHTYVFVGFAEVDSSVDPSVSPQIMTGD